MIIGVQQVSECVYCCTVKGLALLQGMMLGTGHLLSVVESVVQQQQVTQGVKVKTSDTLVLSPLQH